MSGQQAEIKYKYMDVNVKRDRLIVKQFWIVIENVQQARDSRTAVLRHQHIHNNDMQEPPQFTIAYALQTQIPQTLTLRDRFCILQYNMSNRPTSSVFVACCCNTHLRVSGACCLP